MPTHTTVTSAANNGGGVCRSSPFYGVMPDIAKHRQRLPLHGGVMIAPQGYSGNELWVLSSLPSEKPDPEIFCYLFQIR